MMKCSPEDKYKLLDIAAILDLEAGIMEYGQETVDPRLMESITSYRQYAQWLRQKAKE